MRIAIGSDHRGYQLKQLLGDLIRSKGHEVEDVGADGEESVDYPDFAEQVARKISAGEIDRGVLICGTGIGMAITANKFKGVRAGTCTDEVTAEISRRHNNLNVLCLSADMVSPRTAERMVQIWIETEFEGGRHQRRLDKIAEIEKGCN